MNASDLRHKVTIQEPADTMASGEATTTWADVADAWVMIQPLSGREYFQAAQIHGDITHRIVLRWKDADAIKATYRLVYGTRTFYLLGPPLNTGERCQWAEVLCREQVSP